MDNAFEDEHVFSIPTADVLCSSSPHVTLSIMALLVALKEGAAHVVIDHYTNKQKQTPQWFYFILHNGEIVQLDVSVRIAQPSFAFFLDSFGLTGAVANRNPSRSLTLFSRLNRKLHESFLNGIYVNYGFIRLQFGDSSATLSLKLSIGKRMSSIAITVTKVSPCFSGTVARYFLRLAEVGPMPRFSEKDWEEYQH